MEFATREWLTVIIVLLIVAILLDGWRRMRQSRYGSIKMSLSMHKGIDKDDLEVYGSELPNGGARVVGQAAGAETDTAPVAASADAEPARAEPSFDIQEQVGLDLDDQVPMLMESVAEQALEAESPSTATHERGAVEGVVGSARVVRAAAEPVAESEGLDSALAERLMGGRSALRFDTAAPEFDEVAAEPKEPSIKTHQTAKKTTERAQPASKKPPVVDAKSSKSKPKQSAPAELQEVLVINAMAPKGQHFQGAALLDILLDADMRFGEMDIFHRHADDNGEGFILFSMANMVKPGVFNLHEIKQFSTPGVSFFLTLPLPSDSLEAFNVMASTAKYLVDQLGGELKDEQRSVMTNQTLEHCRQRIREFERKRLV